VVGRIPENTSLTREWAPCISRWFCIALTAPFGFFVLTARADDWPQWRGPHRNGISQEAGLLKEWPKGGPKLLWELRDIGDGYSTPAVGGNRIYLLSSRGLDNELVQALEVADGKLGWSTRIGNVGNPNQRPSYPTARSTPTVDGEWLYVLGSDGDLACLATATGRVRWHKSLRTDFGGKSGRWAYSESPLVDGEVLVCTPGGSETTLLALNKETGAVIWKSAVPGGDEAGYASVIVVEAGGRKQYVQFLQKGVVGVDAKTGGFLWRYNQTGKGPANMSTPVAAGGYVYTSNERSGLGGLTRLEAREGGVVAEPVYYQRGLPTSVGGAVEVNGYLYGTNSEGLARSDGLLCVEFTTGKVHWKAQCVGSGSVCCANDRLYVHGENGDVALVELTPAGYHEKGRFTPPHQPKHVRFMERAWPYPVVANGRLYIRDLGSLWCYDIKEPRILH
jgi:outer membrane protein assembly factor BamB